MKKFSFICLLLMTGLVQAVSAAVTKEEADAAYQKNDFNGAIAKYEEILDTQGESAAIYYNLGNAYYKTKNVAKAILNYERALLLNPGDADIRFNLEMARSKAVDQITPTAEVFIVTWYKGMVNALSEKSWGNIGIFSFIFCLVALSFYIFGKKLWLRKVGFIVAAVSVDTSLSVMKMIHFRQGLALIREKRKDIEERTKALVAAGKKELAEELRARLEEDLQKYRDRFLLKASHVARSNPSMSARNEEIRRQIEVIASWSRERAALRRRQKAEVAELDREKLDELRGDRK